MKFPASSTHGIVFAPISPNFVGFEGLLALKIGMAIKALQVGQSEDGQTLEADRGTDWFYDWFPDEAIHGCHHHRHKSVLSKCGPLSTAFM